MKSIKKRTYSLAVISAAQLLAVLSMFLNFIGIGSEQKFSIIKITMYLQDITRFADLFNLDLNTKSISSGISGVMTGILVLTFLLCLLGVLALYLLKNKWAYITNIITSGLVILIYLALLIVMAGLFSNIFSVLGADTAKLFNYVGVLDTKTMFRLLLAGSGPGMWLIFIMPIVVIVVSSLELYYNKKINNAKPVSKPARVIEPEMPKAPIQQPVIATIMGLRGGCQGQIFEFRGSETYILGKDPKSSNIIIADPQVSRKHCAIRFNADRNTFSVTDYSMNGVYDEQGNRLPKNVVSELPRGSEIRLAGVNHIFLLK